MGDSEKLPDPSPASYRFVEHREYLDGFFEAMGLDRDVTLVVHDWGAALGFDWAQRNTGAVTGIAFMEAIVRPVNWDDWNPKSRPVFEALRSPKGEEMVLVRNLFIERILPGSILREMSEAEMEIYRRPFVDEGEDRRAMLTWPRQIPLDGEPEDVAAIVAGYARWMAQNDLPKLFINADPGAILIGAQRDFCRSWKNQTEVTVKGSHFVQEDSPGEIGEAIADWLAGLP